jgi:hypothetical protein
MLVMVMNLWTQGDSNKRNAMYDWPVVVVVTTITTTTTTNTFIMKLISRVYI